MIAGWLTASINSGAGITNGGRGSVRRPPAPMDDRAGIDTGVGRLAGDVAPVNTPSAGDVVRAGRTFAEDALEERLAHVVLVDELHPHVGREDGTGTGAAGPARAPAPGGRDRRGERAWRPSRAVRARSAGGAGRARAAHPGRPPAPAGARARPSPGRRTGDRRGGPATPRPSPPVCRGESRRPRPTRRTRTASRRLASGSERVQGPLDVDLPDRLGLRVAGDHECEVDDHVGAAKAARSASGSRTSPRRYSILVHP